MHLSGNLVEAAPQKLNGGTDLVAGQPCEAHEQARLRGFDPVVRMHRVQAKPARQPQLEQMRELSVAEAGEPYDHVHPGLRTCYPYVPPGVLLKCLEQRAPSPLEFHERAAQVPLKLSPLHERSQRRLIDGRAATVV